MTERRRFNDSERAALYLAADGRCQCAGCGACEPDGCGVALGPGWHADHVQPHSRDGKTDVINGQALCPPCNLAKGNRVNALRAWQQDALMDWQLWTPQDDHGFLVEATPGAGKTRFSIEVAKRLLAASAIERVIVGVPTSRLEKQWADAFAAEGLSVNPDWHARNGAIASDEHGCAATFAEIANQPKIFRRLCTERPTLVILDEVHHCGDEKQWGLGIREAFEPALAKLLLSGTPFRSDNDEIPFVNYIDGVGAPDFRYGYDRALSDGVVRAVFFPRRGGQMEWTAPNGDERSATFDDELATREAAHRLRTALSTKGAWLPSVLRDADKQLRELRESDPKAAGIVFCEDGETARAVRIMLKHVTGQYPELAITGNDEKGVAIADASQRIERFGESSDAWIVTIRMVSEGVDIPRLRVGVYATPWVTELFFRQVVGRVVRVRPDEDDPTSYLFIPDDDRLRTMAAQIKSQRDHVLDVENARLLEDDGSSDDDTEGRTPSLFSPISAVATDQGVIVDASTVTPAEMAYADQVRQKDPATATMPTAIVATLLRNAGIMQQPQPPVAAAAAQNGSPKTYKRKEDLRKQNNARVVQIVQMFGLEYSHVNRHLYGLVGLPVKNGLQQATEDQLKARLQFAQEWITTGIAPQKRAG